MTDTTLSGRVAANLRAELSRRSISQEKFADMAGISRSSLNQRLTGRTVLDLAELEQYADLLGIEPSKLLND